MATAGMFHVKRRPLNTGRRGLRQVEYGLRSDFVFALKKEQDDADTRQREAIGIEAEWRNNRDPC